MASVRSFGAVVFFCALFLSGILPLSVRAQFNLTVVAKEGDIAPGSGEPIASIAGFNVSLADDGTVIFPVQLTDFFGVDAVLAYNGGAVAEVVRSGDPVPGFQGATFNTGALGSDFFAATAGDEK